MTISDIDPFDVHEKIDPATIDRKALLRTVEAPDDSAPRGSHFTSSWVSRNPYRYRELVAYTVDRWTQYVTNWPGEKTLTTIDEHGNVDHIVLSLEEREMLAAIIRGLQRDL